mgnify:CR=1 FL=1
MSLATDDVSRERLIFCVEAVSQHQELESREFTTVFALGKPSSLIENPCRLAFSSSERVGLNLSYKARLQLPSLLWIVRPPASLPSPCPSCQALSPCCSCQALRVPNPQVRVRLVQVQVDVSSAFLASVCSAGSSLPGPSPSARKFRPPGVGAACWPARAVANSGEGR